MPKNLPAFNDLTDEELIQLVQNRNEAAFTELMFRYTPRIWTIIVRNSRQRQDAEEIRNDVWIAVWQNIKGLRKVSSFGEWLQRIAYNACKRYYTSGHRSRNEIPHTHAVLVEHIDQQATARYREAQLIAEVREVVHHLPQKVRSVAELYYLESWNMKEIAEALDLPMGTVKTRLREIRTLLREEFDVEPKDGVNTLQNRRPAQFNAVPDDPTGNTWVLPRDAIVRLGKGNVMDMVLSPDGTLLAIGSYLGLWWYNVPNRSLLTLWEAGKTITTVAFSACGEWVATGGWGVPIKIWDVKSGNCLAELARDKSGYATDIVFSSDRKRLVVGGSTRHSNPEKRLYCSVEIWQLPENLQDDTATALPEREAIYVGTNPLALSPDNRLLAFASPDGVPEPFHTNGYRVINGRWVLASNTVVVYEMATGQHLVTLDGLNDVSSIDFSPSGKFLAACDRKGTTNVWEVPEKLSPETPSWHLHQVYQAVDDNGFHYISWTPENRLLTTVYACRDDTFSVQDLENSEILYRHPKETGYYHPNFSNGVRLAFQSEYNVHIWVAGEDRSIALEHTAGIFPGSLQFSPDSKTLLAKSGYGGILSWDVTHPNDPPRIFKPLGMKPDTDEGEERYLSVDASPEGKHFVTSVDEKNIRLWEFGSDVPIVTFPLQDEPWTAAFAPAANLLACRDEADSIHIWDITTGEIYDTYTGEEAHNAPYLTFNRDGTFLVCAPFQLYDVSQRKTVDQFSNADGFDFLAFSPDPLRVWCHFPAFEYRTIDLWDFQADKEVLSLPQPKWWQEKEINAFAVSACGRYLACSPYTWTDEESVCVWDIRNGNEPIATFKMTERLGCLAFSPDNALLAGACSTGTILLWDLKHFMDT